MISSFLAFLLASVVGTPQLQTLTTENREVSALVPDARVLSATDIHENQIPTRTQKTLGPELSAESFLVLDVGSGAVLTSKNPSVIRSVASLTKLLTAEAVLDHTALEDVVTVGPHAVAQRATGSDMGLVEGERIRVKDLLAGMLIHSSNDAAVALAEHVAGSEAAFANRMNRKAEALGLVRTHMANATGLDNTAHFSSAYDMALLLSTAWKDPVLGVYLRATSMDISSVDGKTVHHVKTTDRLLGERADVLAGKTGFTDLAGQSLAIVAESPDGYPIVAVVLGSTDRFLDMNALLNWTFWAYSWPTPKKPNSTP